MFGETGALVNGTSIVREDALGGYSCAPCVANRDPNGSQEPAGDCGQLIGVAPARRAEGAPLLAQSYPLRCISPLQNSGPPALLIDIPAHGLGNSALEIFLRTPTELALEL
jgi:hypothetical protein